MVADSILQFLLDNVTKLIKENSKLIIELKEEGQSLENDVSMFQAFLKDLEQKQNRNNILIELVKQLRKVLYEAEDALETYVSHVHRQKYRSNMKKLFYGVGYGLNLRDVAIEIKSVSNRVKVMYDRRHIDPAAAVQINDHQIPQNNTTTEVPSVEEENVVGFEDCSQKIIELLNGESEVISIIGMPGLGKTTLAKKILRDLISNESFNNGAYAYVSQHYDKERVLRNILDQLSSAAHEQHRTMDASNLAREISSILEEKRCLIILDDVWKLERDWIGLKNAFQKNNYRSRIIITSPISNVAVYTNYSLHLRLLNDDESWELLKHEARGSEELTSEQGEKIGRRIAKECEGLPLAIQVIGQILQGRETQLSDVDGKVDERLSMDEQKRLENSIVKVFNHLLPHLKPCFLYFGMFPKNSIIRVSKLVRLWIAEGLIEPKGKMTLEDIAEEYLNSLVRMNLVMVVERRSNNKIKICKLHGKLYEICKNKAMEEFAFPEVHHEGNNPKLASDYYRRLGTHFLNHFSLKLFCLYVRCFLSFPNQRDTLSSKLFCDIPEFFKLLRVLDGLTINDLTKFPHDITHLVHLKYLDVSSNFSSLSSKISILHNIQTLILETSSNTLEVKADIWKMSQLRHFKTNASASLLGPQAIKRKRENSFKGKALAIIRKNEIDRPVVNGCLQTLSTISPESCAQDVFDAAPNLKKLGIRGPLAKLMEVSDGSSLFDNLNRLDKLENLKLVNDVVGPPQPVSLPEHTRFPAELKKLTLSNTKLAWELMSELGKLPNLEILKLDDNAFVGEYWNSEDGSFRVLKELHIGTTDLASWEASANAFPSLKRLYLKGCSTLESVPALDVSSPQIIDLRGANVSAADSPQTA